MLLNASTVMVYHRFRCLDPSFYLGFELGVFPAYTVRPWFRASPDLGEYSQGGRKRTLPVMSMVVGSIISYAQEPAML